jgi:hypothetical protein
MRLLAGLIITGWGLVGCASAPALPPEEASANYGRENKRVWVRGPWEDRPGELFLRQGQDWKLIGQILPEDKATGTITPVEE